MKNFLSIFQFGWPYLRRYWGRLATGIMLGVLFGLSNASFLYATKTILVRMDPEELAKIPIRKAEKAARIDSPWKQFAFNLEDRVEKILDPILPMAGRPPSGLQIMGGLIFLPLLVAIRGYLGFLSSYCMAWVGERVVKDLRMDVFQKLNQLSVDFFNRFKMGDLLTRVNVDTGSLQRSFSLGFADAVKAPVTIIGLFGALLLQDWKLTLSTMIVFPLCILPVMILGRKVRKAANAGRMSGTVQTSHLVEMFSGIRVIKAFGLEAAQEERFRRFTVEQVRQAVRTVRAKELINPIIETVSMIALGALIVFITINPSRSVKDMMTFLTGMILIYEPVKKMAGLHVLFEQARVGVERLQELLAEQPSVKEPLQPLPLTRFCHGITFENVSFAYKDKHVLNQINLSIPHGFKLGVAGESGSGKSSLVNLVLRFYDPVLGAIKIDGLDLRSVKGHDLRQFMALVSQEVVLFDLSVAENIACGKPGATQAEVEAAARAAHAHDFILQLPEGYKTRPGERGVTLSGGQRQRIAIARAFVRNSPILVLDEATASLDSAAEAEVQAAIDRLTENRTVICVAHRLSTLRTMDGIIVLEKGNLIEQGSFEELLQAKGIFATMAARQGLFAQEKKL